MGNQPVASKTRIGQSQTHRRQPPNSYLPRSPRSHEQRSRIIRDRFFLHVYAKSPPLLNLHPFARQILSSQGGDNAIELQLEKQSIRLMHQIAKLMASNTGKRLIQIDVSSDTVCPWCFVGKKNLEKAMEQTKDKFDFEVRWHPFFLNPDAPKEGVKKSDFYKTKFGPVQFERATARMTEMFRGLGFEYDMSGLTGNTMDSHRLITLAGHQGCEKQNALVEELFVSYFCQGKYIGDKQVLVDAARKVGIEGAEEFLEDPSKGVDEVKEEFSKYSSVISGVPHFVINGKYQLSGGQPSNIFMRAFDTAAKDGAE